MSTKLTLDGGIALVNGAARGIGEETALAFGEAGAQGVIFADIDQDLAAAVAEKSKQHAKHAEYKPLAVKVDVANAESIQNLISTTVKEFGRIDHAVNSAGIDMEFYKSFTPALDLDIFTRMSETNIVGAVHFVRAVMGAMAQQEPLTFPGTSRHGPRTLGRGSIILMGSTASLVGSPGLISYTTAKHAIIGIMKSAAVDALALQSGMRVIDNMTPLKRAGRPDEVADYIVFLSSSSASFINGTALAIDAGMILPAPPALPY